MRQAELHTPLEAWPAESGTLVDQYSTTRRLSEALVSLLSESDATLQSMSDASPAKWHLAHTTWFFETFVLRDYFAGYGLFDERYAFLFNSYYETEGNRIRRDCRGMLSRPSLAEVLEWRAYVDDAILSVLDEPKCWPLIQLGLAHEQQHQELLLTDIKHALFSNPLGPAMWPNTRKQHVSQHPEQIAWHEHPGEIVRVGADSRTGDAYDDSRNFAFDNEGPAHRVLLEPFALADRLITNEEWEEFIADGGYRTAELWLSDGWQWVQNDSITAPLYWRDGEQFTHYGWIKRDPAHPVVHISYFEADAFARWAGYRLPTEFEWETVGKSHSPTVGNQLDPPEEGSDSANWISDRLVPEGGSDFFGDCWQFTRSAYLPYPRFRPAAGAVGEYNGKFMAGQWVLKGASCATVRGHSRASYRNFFYPHQRWQFTGVRLEKDL